jgi:hypothetical protein
MGFKSIKADVAPYDRRQMDYRGAAGHVPRHGQLMRKQLCVASVTKTIQAVAVDSAVHQMQFAYDGLFRIRYLDHYR